MGSPAADRARALVRARARAKVRNAIVNCHRCPLRATCTRPVPLAGPTPSKILVVGEAPGSTEDAGGQPFMGVSGKLLRSTLSNARVDPAEITFANVVSCRPPNNRTPTVKEELACRVHLQAQVELASPEWILLVGGTALNAWRRDLKISNVHGHPFVDAFDDGWPYPHPFNRTPIYFPIYHPAAALRDKLTKALFIRDLLWFGKMVRARNPFDAWPMKCRCGEDGFMDARDLMVYCDTHYPHEQIEPRPFTADTSSVGVEQRRFAV